MVPDITLSQGGQVGLAPYFHPGRLGSIPAWGSSQNEKRTIYCLP